MRIVCGFAVCLLVQGLHASVMNTFGQVVGSVGTKVSSLLENIFFDVSHALEDQSTAEEWRKRPYVNRSIKNQMPQENGDVTIQVIVSQTEREDAKSTSVEKETQNTNITVTSVTPEKVDTIEIDRIMNSKAQAALTSNILLNKIMEESSNDKCNFTKIIKKVYTTPSSNNNTIEIQEVDKICYTNEIKSQSKSSHLDQQTNATKSSPSRKVKMKELSLESNSDSNSSSRSGSYSGSNSYSDSVSFEVNYNDTKNRDDLLNQVSQLSQLRKSTGNNVHLITKLDIVNQMEPYFAKSIPKQTKQGNVNNSNFAVNINQKNANVFAQNENESEKKISIPHVKSDKKNETMNNSLISAELNNTFKDKNINTIPMPIMFKSKFKNPINITTDNVTHTTEPSADSKGASTDSTGTIKNRLKNQTEGDNIVTQAVNLKSTENNVPKINLDNKLDLKQSNNISEIENIKPVEDVKVGIELQSNKNTLNKNISNKTNHNVESEYFNTTNDKSLSKSVPSVISENEEKRRYDKTTNETNKGKKNSQYTDIENPHLSDIANKTLLHLPTQQTENKKKESIKNENDLFSIVSNQNGSQDPNLKSLHNDEPEIPADISAAKAIVANIDKGSNHQNYPNTFLRLENKDPIKAEHKNVTIDTIDASLLEPLALKIDEDPIEDNKPVDVIPSFNVKNAGNNKTEETDKQKYDKPEIKNRFQDNGINDKESTAKNTKTQAPNIKSLHNDEPDIPADTSAAKAVIANNEKERNHQSYPNTFLRLENKDPIKAEHENLPTDKTDKISLEPLALKIDEDPIEDNQPVNLITSSDVTNVGNNKTDETDKQKYDNHEIKNSFQDDGINDKESTVKDMKTQAPNVKVHHNDEPEIPVDRSASRAVVANNGKERNHRSYPNTFLRLENKDPIKVEHENVPTDKIDTILLEPLALKIDEDPIEDNKPVDLITSSDDTNEGKNKTEETDNQKYDNPEINNIFQDNGINDKESTTKDTRDNNKDSYIDSVKSQLPDTNGVKLSNESSDHEPPSILPENYSAGPNQNTDNYKTEIDKPTDVIDNEKNLQNKQASEKKIENNKQMSNNETNDLKTYPEDTSEKNNVDDKLNDDIISDLRPDSEDKSTTLNNNEAENEETSDAENNIKYDRDENDVNSSVGESSLDINKSNEQNNIPDITDEIQDEGTSDLDEHFKSELDDNENTNDEAETITNTSKDIPDIRNSVDIDTISDTGTVVDQSTDGLSNLENREVANNEEIIDPESNFQDQLDNENNEVISNEQDQEIAEGLSTLDNDDTDNQNNANVKEGHSEDETGNENSVNIGETENTDRVANNPSDEVDTNDEVDIKNSDLENNYRGKPENQNDEPSIPVDPPILVDDHENDEIDQEPNVADPDGDTKNSLDDDGTSHANNQEPYDDEGDDDEKYQDSS